MKSAVALAYDAGVDPNRCDLALDYLLNEVQSLVLGISTTEIATSLSIDQRRGRFTVFT